MSVITGVGKYVQWTKRPAFVEFEHDGFWFGRFETHYGSWAPGKWSTDGKALICFNDITGPWIEEPDPVFYRRRIEQPAPKFKVGDRVRIARKGSQNWYASMSDYIGHVGEVCEVLGDGGCRVEGAGKWFYLPDCLEHAPFRISDHGLGVYETRDGCEEPVRHKFDGREKYPSGEPYMHSFMWASNSLTITKTWRDDGSWSTVVGDESRLDLVRYLRPLPTPEPFRISDHGLGVYQIRDGRTAEVTGRSESTWSGTIDGYGWTAWFDDGTQEMDVKRPIDLVRYLRPLPEEWTACDEWKVEHDGFVAHYMDCEPPKPLRKWTCGDKVEWREE